VKKQPKNARDEEILEDYEEEEVNVEFPIHLSYVKVERKNYASRVQQEEEGQFCGASKGLYLISCYGIHI